MSFIGGAGGAVPVEGGGGARRRVQAGSAARRCRRGRSERSSRGTGGAAGPAGRAAAARLPRAGGAAVAAGAGGGGGRGGRGGPVQLGPGVTRGPWGIGPQGLPLVKPPYGRITAYNMNTGDIAWQVANGDTYDWIKTHPALQGMNIPKTGRADEGGILVTKTLAFAGQGCGLFRSGGGGGPMFYAYDKKTGDGHARDAAAGGHVRQSDDLPGERQAVHRGVDRPRTAASSSRCRCHKRDRAARHRAALSFSPPKNG